MRWWARFKDDLIQQLKQGPQQRPKTSLNIPLVRTYESGFWGKPASKQLQEDAARLARQGWELTSQQPQTLMSGRVRITATYKRTSKA